MKKFKFYLNQNLLCILFALVFMSLLQSCVALNGEKMKTWFEMTPKEKITVAYSTYNSEFSSHKTYTGWIMNEKGVWEKKFFPTYTEDEKNMLQKKKAILMRMWPIIKLYDNMIIGKTPYSAETEADLYELITDLAGLVPG